MVMVAERTTQDLGVPVSPDQYTKLLLLQDLDVINLREWLNPCDYSSSLREAKWAFDQRFAFYDLLNLNASSNDNLSLIKVNVLWRDFMDYCACTPKILLDRRRYSRSLDIARRELQERIVSYDLHKAPTGCYGELRCGKTGWICVHAWHGKEWFDIPVIVYKSRYNEEAFGEVTYLNEELFLKEIQKVTKLVDQGKGRAPKLEWAGRNEADKLRIKQETADILKLRDCKFIIDEAKKVVGKDHRTLMSMFIKDMNTEWGHYRFQPIYITPRLQLLDREGILQDMVIEMGVSRSYTEPDTSLIDITHRITGDVKPIIHLCRKDYYPLWTHDSLISSRSLVTARDVRRMLKDKEQEEEGE